MKNELLHIGPLTVYGYGLMIALGVIAVYLTMEYRASKRGYRTEHVLPLFLWCLAGGFAGAKLAFLFTEWKYFVRDPGYYLMHFSDGFVVYGGIILGILTGFLYCMICGLNFLSWADLFLPSVALGQAFGRVGCFLAGCCYGKETDLPFGIVFHNSEFAPNNVRLYPTQLISAAFDAALFLVLITLAKHTKKDGTVAVSYLVLYSIGRFLIEFLRGDPERGTIGPLSTSQAISLAALIFITITAIISTALKKRA
ncbi:MAG: prolipoprotein diacylglyceryl transferase [Blautia sp.]|nr:prolipoprotein diacylglyceryl transferase [Blautia sp.]